MRNKPETAFGTMATILEATVPEDEAMRTREETLVAVRHRAQRVATALIAR